MMKNSIDDCVSLHVKARFDDLPNLDKFIFTAVKQVSSSGQAVDADSLSGDLILAVHEVCANMIDHAYKAEGDHPIEVSFCLDSMQQEIIIEVVDQGDGFNPKRLKWPPPHSWDVVMETDGQSFVLGQVPEPELEAERGRGVYLLTKLLDGVTYSPRAGKNYWKLKKNYCRKSEVVYG